MNFESPTNFFTAHPIIGMITSTFLVVLAEIPQEYKIPIWIMQSFQLLAWTGAILVSFVTIHGWYKKNSSKDKNGR